MIGLSGEEARLQKEISKLEQIFEKNKWKRTKTTLFILSGVVYIAAFALGEMNSIVEYLGWLVAAPIFAGLIMFASILITLYISSGAMSEAKIIARLEGELLATMRLNKKNDEL